MGLFGELINGIGDFFSSEVPNCCAKCKYCSCSYADGYNFYVCNEGCNPYNVRGVKLNSGKRILGVKWYDLTTQSACNGNYYQYWDDNNPKQDQYNNQLEQRDFVEIPDSEPY